MNVAIIAQFPCCRFLERYSLTAESTMSSTTVWLYCLPIDAILALRLLSEIHREFERLLAVTYLDIKAAFDSVGRLAL